MSIVIAAFLILLAPGVAHAEDYWARCRRTQPATPTQCVRALESRDAEATATRWREKHGWNIREGGISSKTVRLRHAREARRRQEGGMP